MQNHVLFGNDKAAYEIIKEAASNFKDPSSVRLVSGTLGTDKDCMFCGISATNGFGGRSISYYFIIGGMILEEDNPTALYRNMDGLNFSKINRILETELRNIY